MSQTPKGKALVIKETTNRKKQAFSATNDKVPNENFQKQIKELQEENKILKNQVTNLECLLALAKDEIEEKDEAILELYELVNVLEKKIDKLTNQLNQFSLPFNFSTTSLVIQI